MHLRDARQSRCRTMVPSNTLRKSPSVSLKALPLSGVSVPRLERRGIKVCKAASLRSLGCNQMSAMKRSMNDKCHSLKTFRTTQRRASSHIDCYILFSKIIIHCALLITRFNTDTQHVGGIKSRPLYESSIKTAWSDWLAFSLRAHVIIGPFIMVRDDRGTRLLLPPLRAVLLQN
ncbi:hypothetical protein DL93DRAFT_447461 [Clavulina sp. PMI_390]|nr:hypothetical protein DL93DRAFT_447461 [Clavulina sp. PMI_390]